MAQPLISRRLCLRRAGQIALGSTALGLLGASSGCGFKLRGHYTMAFRSIQLSGFASTSPLAVELARALQATGVDVVDSTLAATQAASSASVPNSHVVLEGLTDRRDIVVTTTTAYGQVRDMTARTLLRFQVRRADGSVLLAPADVALNREMTYNEKDALAKQDESDALHRAMQSDIINQVLRRLSAIRADQLVPPPAAASVASSVSATAQAPAPR